jgi:plasmid stabilization system protein ParE
MDIAEDGPEAAEQLRGEFHETLKALSQSPGIGHSHEELLPRQYAFGTSTRTLSCMRGKQSRFKSSPSDPRFHCRALLGRSDVA